MLIKIFSKPVVLTTLVGLLLIGSAKPMQAYSNCPQKIRKAERNLERAIQRHGVHSIQAAQRRDQLERVQARCRH